MIWRVQKHWNSPTWYWPSLCRIQSQSNEVRKWHGKSCRTYTPFRAFAFGSQLLTFVMAKDGKKSEILLFYTSKYFLYSNLISLKKSASLDLSYCEGHEHIHYFGTLNNLYNQFCYLIHAEQKWQLLTWLSFLYFIPDMQSSVQSIWQMMRAIKCVNCIMLQRVNCDETMEVEMRYVRKLRGQLKQRYFHTYMVIQIALFHTLSTYCSYGVNCLS